MTQIGTEINPLRIAIIGAGPSGFYAADHLFKQKDVVVAVDMFDKLPTPFGLVRFGVAPDHDKIKTVTKVYDGIAANKRYRFFGNVEFGKHVLLADLMNFYHQIIFTNGAATDRRMGIPGEDLKNSCTATEFVAWYNGHPDYRDLKFDLSQERAAVIGVGNVAIDVARILCSSAAELGKTDIADYALDALKQSRVKEVYLIGRRGPVQAAFTPPEVKEVGELEDADAISLPDEMKLDALSQAEYDSSKDALLKRKVETLQSYSGRTPTGKAHVMYIRFLLSPTELFPDGSGRVAKMKLVRNTLVKSDSGALSAKSTDQFQELPVGLVFRSVGYRGVALPGVPFDDKGGKIPNEKGRVLDSGTKQLCVGLYCAGWIKRGPSGVIGTNKPDSVETATMMLQDSKAGTLFNPANPDPADAERFIASRQAKYFSYADWLKLDKLEVARGEPQGRPRVKFTSVDEMLKALGK